MHFSNACLGFLLSFAVKIAEAAIVNSTVPLPIYTPEMRSGKDYSSVPKISVKPIGSGSCSNSKCEPDDCKTCWETCGNCPDADSIYGCEEKVWTLTFDDGPSEFTPILLDVLKERNIKATFFLLGSQVAKFPETVKRIWNEGHLIGSHTWSHSSLMSLTDDQIIAEIKQTEDLIANLTNGFRPKYIRPPFGQADERVKAIFKVHDLRNILWNMDCVDYESITLKKDPSLILKAFQDAVATGTNINNPFNNPGIISLQHDIFLESIRQENSIIDLLIENGYSITTLATCLNDATPYKDLEDRFVSSSIDIKNEAGQPDNVKS